MKLVKHFLSALFIGSALISNVALAEEKAQEQKPSTVQTTEIKPAKHLVVSDRLNINTATASEIQKALIGIGAKKAEAIVQYREKHGNFTDAEQLLEVQGIGKATLEKNRDRLAF